MSFWDKRHDVVSTKRLISEIFLFLLAETTAVLSKMKRATCFMQSKTKRNEVANEFFCCKPILVAESFSSFFFAKQKTLQKLQKNTTRLLAKKFNLSFSAEQKQLE